MQIIELIRIVIRTMVIIMVMTGIMITKEKVVTTVFPLTLRGQQVEPLLGL